MEKPIYKNRERVKFRCNGQILEGVIGIVDTYGTMEQNKEPSYDIEVGGTDFTLYKHIPESDIICKIFQNEKSHINNTLPLFLRESISAFLVGKEKHESGIGYTEFDMDYCDLQTDINVCEVEQMITPEEAWELREKYLGLQKG